MTVMAQNLKGVPAAADGPTGRSRPAARRGRRGRRRRARPTICLGMIVRDEAHVIEETLASVAPLIDTWVIVDTGSTDATPAAVERFFDARGIPGELHHRPWVDFGTNRTEALDLCRGKADYVWVMDADDLVVGALDLSRLHADAYLLRFGPDPRYWRLQLFRTTRRFCYFGSVHEFATCEDGPYTEARLEGDYHIVSRRLGARGRRPDTYRRDAALLREAVARDPHDARAVFYLAQSLLDAGDVSAALVEYDRRAAMGGWPEETFWARLQAAACRERLGEPFPTVLGAYLEAWQTRPKRAEALVDAARLSRIHGQFQLAALLAGEAARRTLPADDRLFVRVADYEWRALDELAVAAFHAGRPQESFDACMRLLRSRALPETERPRVEANRDLAVPSLLEDTAAYPAGLVKRLTRRQAARRRPPEVTLTITSCKRLHLFERTVNSFLNCCEDIGRIGRFVCVDDNSTAADRIRMRARYPFFEFIGKSPAEKGHARSMNLLRELVSSPYWLHLEDDWHFFVRERYVARALAILADDPDVAQVLFNPNYAETLDDRTIAGARLRLTRSGMRYRLHQHVPPETPAFAALTSVLGPDARTSLWWPHYSLRPSIVRTSAVREIGPYDPAAEHFELDYARRWTAAGYASGAFDTVTCLHTGTLTSESGPGRQPNAYDLNGESHFGLRPRSTPRSAEPPPAPAGGVTIVTGYLDLSAIEPRPAGKDWEDYRAAARWTLSVPLPLVAFLDEARLEELRRLRPGGPPTLWQPSSLTACRWWPELKRVTQLLRRRVPLGSSLVKDSPAYLITTWQKTEWLRQVAETDPFGTSHVAWLDLAFAAHTRSFVPHAADAALRQGLDALCAGLPGPGTLRLCAMEHVPAEIAADRDTYYAQHRFPVAGGAVLGDREAVRWFADRVAVEIAACLEAGIAITEEMMWGRIVALEPERFQLHYGRWEACLTNFAGPVLARNSILAAAARCRDAAEYAAAAARQTFAGEVGTEEAG